MWDKLLYATAGRVAKIPANLELYTPGNIWGTYIAHWHINHLFSCKMAVVQLDEVVEVLCGGDMRIRAYVSTYSYIDFVIRTAIYAHTDKF